MKELTITEFYNYLDSVRVYKFGSIANEEISVNAINEFVEENFDKVVNANDYELVMFYKKSFGAVDMYGSELRHKKGAKYYLGDNSLIADFGWCKVVYGIHSYYKVVE